jgi:hypothetical protein
VIKKKTHGYEWAKKTPGSGRDLGLLMGFVLGRSGETVVI